MGSTKNCICGNGDYDETNDCDKSFISFAHNITQCLRELGINELNIGVESGLDEALALMKEYEVTPEAWGPFAEGKHGIFTNPVLTGIGEKYGKSAAQVVLRWNVQRGVVVIPKSVHRDRMEQNIDIWDFKLTDEEMESIKPLDIGHSEIVNHFDPNFVKMLHGISLR